MSQTSKIPAELLKEMTPAVRVFVEALLLRLVKQEKRIAELEAKLNKTSRNSSKPPSSEHPHAKPEPPPKRKSRRKRGGQAGHDKFERALIPTDDCNENRYILLPLDSIAIRAMAVLPAILTHRPLALTVAIAASS
jgi:Family of unknown function (DUF6444)